MDIDHPRPDSMGRARGFSLIELIVVVAIIMIIAATSFPAIGRFIRNYQIRGAAEEVAAEIQAAKLLAVKKNVNFGVVFVVLTDRTYQFFMEDIPLSGQRQLYAGSQQGRIRTLPTGITFDATGGADAGFRFNRLGAMCDPDTGALLTCPDLGDSVITPPPTGNFVSFVAGNPDPTLDGARINLSQSDTGLTRTLVVTPGGRVKVLNQ
jgi:prepilin-type N-terminal cleavage/methylation domain-containing protein